MSEDKELPKGWIKTTLGDVCIKAAIVQRKALNPEGEFLYLDIGAIDNAANKIISHKKYLWKEAPSRAQQIVFQNDTLFSTVRTYLRNIALIETKLYDGQIATTGFTVIRGNSLAANPKFLFYLSLSHSFLQPLNELQTGTSYPAVRDNDVFSQSFLLPPLPEQRRIVAKIEELFSSLDKGIESLKTAQEQLKIYRQAVLKWAFEGRLTNKEVKDGELPEGWVWKTIKEIGKVKGGKRLPKGHTYSEEKTNFPYIRVTDFENLTIKQEKLKYLFPETQKHIKNYIISKNDVFISIAGTIGQAGVIPENLDGANLTENASKITELKEVYNKYLANYLASKTAQTQIAEHTIATTQPKLSLFRIEKINVPIPPTLSEQHHIVSEIESRLSVCDKIEESIGTSLQQAEALRQSILKKAFEGKLVPQDPDDEPAGVLLERIKAEREKAAPAGRKVNSRRKSKIHISSGGA